MSKLEHFVAVALVQRDGRWLIARRRADAHLGGLWEFPGGKLHAGESVVEAALRELHEECAIEASAVEVLESTRLDYGDRLVTLTPVVCRWVSGEAQPLASDECRWIRLGEFAEYDMPAANRTVIAALHHALQIPD